MGSLRFRCDACGRAFALPEDQIPPQGLRGPCGACGAVMTLFPDGRMLGATPVEAPRPAAGPEPAPPEASPLPSGKLTFRCPSCGHPHEVDPSRLPAAGAKGPCKGCGVRLVLYRDGGVRLEGPEAKAPSPQKSPVSESWTVKMGDSELGPFSHEEMRELAANGRLSLDQPVKPSGGAWVTVAAIPVLASLVARTSGSSSEEEPPPDAIGDEDRCYAHPDTPPARVCARCGRFLCEACLKPLQGQPGVKPVFLCSACGGTTAALHRRAKWIPFYRDLGQVFASPFKGGAWIYFIFMAFLEALKVPCQFAPLVGMAALFVLACVQATFYIHLIREVANGSYDLPEWPDATNYWDMVVTFLKTILVVLISLIPVILLFCLGGAGIGVMAGLAGAAGSKEAVVAALGPLFVLVLLVGLFYLIYLPICMAIVAVFDTVLPALNPILIFRIIFRIGGPYFIAVTLWLCLLVIGGVAGAFLGKVPVAGALALAPLTVYLNLVSAYILGRVCYENEEKIGWH
ncbi:MAG: DUF4013 domain-containing protein [Acidobacteriota bacterium]